MNILCTKNYTEACAVTITSRTRQVPNAICIPCKSYRQKLRYAMLPKYKKKRIKMRVKELRKIRKLSTVTIKK